MAGTTNKSWNGDASRFTDQQYRRSCIINRGGAGSVKEECSLPVREPDGTLNLNALSAAAGRLGGTQRISDAERSKAARKLVGLYKANSMEPPPKLLAAAGMKVEEAFEEGPVSLNGELGELPTPSASSLPNRQVSGLVVQAGAAGLPVRRVQQQLITLGFPVLMDGRFGTQTSEAVKSFQQQRGLKPDGVVGRQTMAALHGEPASTPGPLRARHVRRLGMALARRGGGSRRRLTASASDEADAAREIVTTSAWEDFGRAVEHAFLPGGGGGGEETIGGTIDADGDNDESPDMESMSIPPGTGTVGAPSARVRVAQRALKAQGHYDGEVDGVYGPKTIGAVRSFQTSAGGLRPHGTLDGTTLEALDSAAGTMLMESMARVGRPRTAVTA